MDSRGSGSDTSAAESTAWSDRAASVAAEDRSPLGLPRSLMAEVFAHARECYPEECCGIVVATPAGERRSVVRCTNVQNQRFSRGESELDARRAFWIDEQELERALRAAEENEQRLMAIYHSHVDTGAYLSHADVSGAIGSQGQPLWPKAGQLVVSVHEGEVQDVAWYDWDPGRERFVGRPVHEKD